MLVYRLCVRLLGAAQSNGARGNVYKLLEQLEGMSAPSDKGSEVIFQGAKENDLLVRAYFPSRTKATEFWTTVQEWPKQKTFLLVDGAELVDPPIYATNTAATNLLEDNLVPLDSPPTDLERYVLDQHYIPGVWESTISRLDQPESKRLLLPPNTEMVADPKDPLILYQALEVVRGRNKHYYKYYLSDKENRSSNPGNILVASAAVCQALKGSGGDPNGTRRMPVIKLSAFSASRSAVEEMDNRFRIQLQLEFLYKRDATLFQCFQKTPSIRVDDYTWQVVVHVPNRIEFLELVEAREMATQMQWDQHNWKDIRSKCE